MRSIEDKLQHIPLGTGINQSAGTHGSAPGTLEYAINSRIRSSGRLQRRCGSNGIAALSKGGGGARAVSNSTAIPRPTEHPAFIASVGDTRLVGTTAGDMFFYDGTFHEFRGCFSAAQPISRTAAIATANQDDPLVYSIPAVAVTSTGYKIVATVTTALSMIWVVINPEGAVVYRGEGITVSGLPKAVVQGTKLILAVQHDGTEDIDVYSHETSTGIISVSAVSAVMSLRTTASFWDCSSYNSTHWVLVGRTGPTAATIQYMADTVAGITASISMTGECKLSVWSDATNSIHWVGYLDDPSGTPKLGFTTFDNSLNTVYLKTLIASGVPNTYMPPLFGPRYSRAGANSDVFYVIGAVPTNTVTTAYSTWYGYIVSGTPNPSTPLVMFHVLPVSKPDVQQRFWVVPDLTDDLTPGQFLLLRFGEPPDPTTPNPLTVELSTPLDVGAGTTTPIGAFHSVAVQSETAGDSTLFALPVSVAASTGSNMSGEFKTVATIAMLHEYTRYNQSPRIDAALSDELVIAGQPTSTAGLSTTTGNAAFGGIGAVEIGIPLIPRIFSTSQTPSGTGLPAGSYQYVAIHQWVDSLGRRHISAPSLPTTVDVTVPSSVTVNVSDCQLGQRQVGTVERVHTLLYRTLVGGEIAQLLPFAEGPTATGLVAFTDSTSDSLVGENEFLPTAGGVLPSRLGPACRFIRAAEERLWCAGLWDREIVEASRVRVPGEPYHFTGDPTHQVVLPAPCTGLAYQDGQIVAFTERSIYLIGGDGPNDQGAGQFLPPRALVNSLGCPEEESASILETEEGIFFRSSSSWWLIPRGFGAPIDVGAEIQDEASQHVISSAVTETSDYRLARFLVGADGDFSSSTILTFDLANKQWFRDTYPEALGVIGRWPDALALFRYSLEDSSGAVATVISYEDEDVTTDNNTPANVITQSFRTNWIYPFGLGGWGKVNTVILAAEVISGTQDLTITVETDENTETPAAWSIDSTHPVVYRQVTPGQGKQRCTCYRVTGSAVSTAPSTEGLRFLSLTAELEPDGGRRPLTDSERA